ncbi:hypothetical protein PR048_011499 [Dryococelus australis]|uniref:Uncharacterized protein n=1 Tax=Dryococelus australis TaxID=614101 RepID=A0ABQ9HLT1_9NEOP|nr:hypothetical protein PR048_011499 [Dryococelus australis]
MNHRLELALSDAVDEVSGVNSVFKYLWIICTSFYNNLPKNQCQLAECGVQFDQQVKKIGKVFSKRWVAISPSCIIIFLHQKMTKVEVRWSEQCTQKCIALRKFTEQTHDRDVSFIDNLKEKPETKCLEARVAIKEGNFCGVTLIENIKISAINPQHF